ncbi:MT-A70 family methyltransferase [Paracoccus homiensis]|uniref:MT-A70 n=1 Tax=Paracoccus homiensis TaxID=364199 RepID=A0A1H9Y9L6_9RHOB|nr:MT-A70 family methyltransferase [Paracoccus homiensis]SES65519.1 MT-A70 [Paracoccus homiensis]
MSAADEFLALRPAEGFDLIMVDPLWQFTARSAKSVTAKSAGGQYRCMSLGDIAALPVATLAARDCLLWLWATNPMLAQALGVMKAWGFANKTGGHWVKRTKYGKLAFGTGYVLRCAGEPFMIGTIGRPRPMRSVRSVIGGQLRDLHGYRVALEPCPCRATKSTASSRLRENLATALKLLSSRGL